MPTGIPGSGPRGGFHSTSKDDLRERIKEIEQRIKQMDRRDKALGEMKKWLAARQLDLRDLWWMYRQLAPKRASAAVKSKKPLQPVKRSAGQIVSAGKIVPAKGDA